MVRRERWAVKSDRVKYRFLEYGFAALLIVCTIRWIALLGWMLWRLGRAFA